MLVLARHSELDRVEECCKAQKVLQSTRGAAKHYRVLQSTECSNAPMYSFFGLISRVEGLFMSHNCAP